MKNLINENTICRLQIDMPSSIDPVFAADTISREIIDNVYEKLFSFIGDNCVPILVKKWWIKFDKIYFFELKRNIYFHDGLECDSYAVQKSLIRMLNESKKANELFNGLLNPNNIVCLNKYLFSIELDKNCLDLIYFLAIQESSIISPRLLDNPTLLSETSSGTGPFKIKNIDTYNKEIILERFDNYWEKKAASNYIRIICESNYEKRKQLFLTTGDIMAVQASKSKDFEKYTDIEMKKFPALDMVLFVLNSNRTPLNINEFRKALILSFDYENFLEFGRKGMGERVNTAIPKGVYSHNSNIPLINYNIDEAKRIIKTINLVNIPKLKVLSVLGMEDADIACNILKNGFQLIGIDLEIIKLPFSQFCKEFDLGEFDLSFLSYAPDTNNPYSFTYDFYHKNGEIANVVGFNNSKINHLINKVRFEKDNPKKYNIYSKIQDIAYNEHLYLWLYQGQNLKVYKSNLSNVSHNILDGDYNFKNIIKLKNKKE